MTITADKPNYVTLMDRMVARLPADERRSFERSTERGYLVLRHGQSELQSIWTLWCLNNLRPDIRVELGNASAAVVMHLATCGMMLSADGMNAVRRAFERHAGGQLGKQTRNWCLQAGVPLPAATALAANLLEIAFLDGVPREA